MYIIIFLVVIFACFKTAGGFKGTMLREEKRSSVFYICGLGSVLIWIIPLNNGMLILFQLCFTMLHWQLFDLRNVQRQSDDPGLLPVMSAKKQFYFGS